MRRASRSRCPIFIETQGTITPTDLFGSAVEQPTDITIKTREMGWKPFRARFDEAQLAWIVSAIDWYPRARRASR